MRTNYRYIPLVFIMVMLSCITPISIDNEREERILVVEGYISTLPGPYNITLTESAKYGTIFEAQITPQKGAEVWIRDDEGNNTFLTEIRSGIYQTPPDFRGQVGKTYTLNIITATGIRYASRPETITPVPPVESVTAIYKKQPSTDPNDFVSGMEVYVNWQDPPDEKNFYIWRNTGVYSIETFPENFVIPGPRGQSSPSPKDCCKICWINERNADYGIYIFSDENTNGMENTQLAAYIEDNGARYYEKYQVSIRQLSLSREAFQFFDLLKEQKSIDGDIFDPPPATIRGNFINLDENETPVIGYFHASDGFEIKTFLDRDQLEDEQRAFVFNDDCRVLGNSTTVEPDDWN